MMDPSLAFRLFGICFSFVYLIYIVVMYIIGWCTLVYETICRSLGNCSHTRKFSFSSQKAVIAISEYLSLWSIFYSNIIGMRPISVIVPFSHCMYDLTTLQSTFCLNDLFRIIRFLPLNDAFKIMKDEI